MTTRNTLGAGFALAAIMILGGAGQAAAKPLGPDDIAAPAGDTISGPSVVVREVPIEMPVDDATQETLQMVVAAAAGAGIAATAAAGVTHLRARRQEVATP